MDTNSEFDHPASDESAAIKSESHFTLHGCIVSRPRLDRLWGLAREGFPANAFVEITSKRKGKVEVMAKSNSIDGLLEVLRENTISENPDYLDNLQLRISTAGRSVSIRILSGKDVANEGVHVSVSGDEEWVRGRSSILRELVEDTQSPLITGRGHSRFPLLLTGIAVAAGISYPIANALGRGSSPQGIMLLLFSLGALLGGGGFFVGSLIDRRRRTHLDLHNQTRRPNIDKMGIAGLVVGILGVIATVIAILVAHSDAIRPHLMILLSDHVSCACGANAA